MIFVDTNVFLRYLVAPATPQDIAMAAQATDLFADAEREVVVLTTSEAVLAEVVFIVSDNRHYNTPRSTVVLGLLPLLKLRAFRLPTKALSLRALDLWEANPKFSYPDALGAAYSELRRLDLATFDKRLSALPHISLHVWRASDATTAPS